MQLARIHENALAFFETNAFAVHEIPHVSTDDVGEFEIDMPMAFRAHVRILMQQRMFGE